MRHSTDRSTQHTAMSAAVETPGFLSDAGSGRLSANKADVGAAREHSRRRRLTAIFAVLALVAVYLWTRVLEGNAFDILHISWPTIDPMLLLPGLSS